jgi:phage portal protein BeeE
MQNNVAKFTLPRVEPRLTAKVATVESKGLADPWPDLYAMFGVSATASGLTISADRALQFPAVSSAIRLLSEAVASLKLTAKKRGADGREVDVPGHAVLGLLTGAANDWTSSYEFIRDLMIDALSDDRGGLGHVNRVNGTAIELIRYRSGVLNVQYNQDTGEPTYAFSTRKVPLQDVIHVRAPFGRSPLSLAREAIATGIVLSDHAAKLFGNGARPSGVLSFPKGNPRGAGRWRENCRLA